MLVDIDALGGRVLGQSGHRAHIAADRVDESRTDARPNLADRQSESRRSSFELWVERRTWQFRIHLESGQKEKAIQELVDMIKFNYT